MKSKNALKVLGALLCTVGLSACAMSPEYNVEQTVVESRLDPTLVFERTTISDNQGTTTWDVTQQGGVVKTAVKHNKASNAEQDMALTVTGAVAGPLTNGLVAHSLLDRQSDCSGGGCSGGSAGQQQVQVQVNTQSASTSEAGGCSTCALLE
jgi:hypothetical protein